MIRGIDQQLRTRYFRLHGVQGLLIICCIVDEDAVIVCDEVEYIMSGERGERSIVFPIKNIQPSFRSTEGLYLVFMEHIIHFSVCNIERLYLCIIICLRGISSVPLSPVLLFQV